MAELKQSEKPFVILLNTTKPNDDGTKNLAKSLQQKYSAKVLPLNVKEMTTDNIAKIFNLLLEEFPVNLLQIKMPKWMEALPFDSPLISEIVTEVKQGTQGLEKIGDFKLTKTLFESSENFEPLTETQVQLGEGNIILSIVPKPELFYKVLSDECGVEIKSDYELISSLKDLSHAKKEYDKLKSKLFYWLKRSNNVIVVSESDWYKLKYAESRYSEISSRIEELEYLLS